MLFSRPQIWNAFISILIFFCAQVCQAQKNFTTQIRFPESIDCRRVIIEYDDGHTIREVSPAAIKNLTTFSGTFYSKYVTLSILYLKTERAFYNIEYFLQKGHSSLIFEDDSTGDPAANPLNICKLSNAIEIRKLPIAKELDLFTEKEQLEVKEYQHKTDEQPEDSLYRILHMKSDTLVKKQMEFVKQHIDNYYSLWLFRRHFLGVDCVQRNYEGLSKLFASFPAAFRRSFEGKEIVKRMYGVVYTKKGYKAPVFTTKDNTGARISLTSFKGKYVLLQFWASYCVPCVEEIPAIKNIRDAYSTDQLRVISISIDKDAAAFDKAVQKHQMNWINIQDNTRTIIDTYGGKPIPSIYLINKEGIIVYSSWEERLDVLKELLARSIK